MKSLRNLLLDVANDTSGSNTALSKSMQKPRIVPGCSVCDYCGSPCPRKPPSSKPNNCQSPLSKRRTPQGRKTPTLKRSNTFDFAGQNDGNKLTKHGRESSPLARSASARRSIMASPLSQHRSPSQPRLTSPKRSISGSNEEKENDKHGKPPTGARTPSKIKTTSRSGSARKLPGLRGLAPLSPGRNRSRGSLTPLRSGSAKKLRGSKLSDLPPPPKAKARSPLTTSHNNSKNKKTKPKKAATTSQLTTLPNKTALMDAVLGNGWLTFGSLNEGRVLRSRMAARSGTTFSIKCKTQKLQH